MIHSGNHFITLRLDGLRRDVLAMVYTVPDDFARVHSIDILHRFTSHIDVHTIVITTPVPCEHIMPSPIPTYQKEERDFLICIYIKILHV